MAVLTSPDGADVRFGAQCIVGRTAPCDLRIDDRFVSSQHAKLTWTGSEWLLRDLASSNGTFVNGKRLEPGNAFALTVGDKVGFGKEDGDWTFSDASAPVALATNVETREVHAAIGDLLVLPDDNEPEITIFVDAQTGSWMLENSDGGRSPVEDGQVAVLADGRAYRLDLPIGSEATPLVDVAMTLQTVDFRLAVSSDEERVEVGVFLRGKETKLEVREHGYLLLTLARERDKDKEAGVAQPGWRTNAELTRMLRLDTNALRVSTHRARQQLAAIGLEGAAGIIETKRGAKRIGTDRYEIVRLPPEP